MTSSQPTIDAQLMPALLEFQHFYATLQEKRDIFYMFFTSGLLHWVAKASSLVPPEIPLVLIGSDLDQEEVRWIAAHLDRPFHHIAQHVDDKAVWEILFAVNEENFGWLDIDCFVLNAGLFAEMTQIAPDVAINCIWVYTDPANANIQSLRTNFVFLNAQVIREIQAKVAVSPCTYHFEATTISRQMPGAQTKVLAEEQIALLREVLPTDASDMIRPVWPNQQFFDTLIVYQFIAQSLGYHLRQIRWLSGLETDPNYFSDEIIHAGGVSFYPELKQYHDASSQQSYQLMLLVDYVLLERMVKYLPRVYQTKQAQLVQRVMELGLQPAHIMPMMVKYLEQRGIAGDTIEGLLR